jgi:hypothetical protein
MKVSLPYFYHVEHQAEGSDETLRRPVAGLITCDIKDVTTSELTTVGSWNLNAGRRDWIPVSCARYGENLYLPALDRHFHPIVAADLVKSGRRMANDYHRVRDLYRGAVTTTNIGHLLHEYATGSKSFRATNKGRIIDSDEMECVKAVEVMADRLLLAGGVMWQQVSGVHVKIFKARDTIGREALFQSIDYSKNGGRDWHLDDIFGDLDEYKNPRISLNRLHQAQNFTEEEQHPDFRDLCIVDETAFHFDGRSAYLARLLHQVVSKTAHDIGNFSNADVTKWLQLRDARDAYYDDGRYFIDEPVVQTFRSFPPIRDLILGRSIERRSNAILDTYEELDLQPTSRSLLANGL